MCTINEDNTIAPDVKVFGRIGHHCMKCEGNAAVVIRGADSFCRACFIGYATHKFRATLGKSKAIRQGEKVLLALSGGPASCCMLELVRQGLDENAHKKLRFIPSIIFVDEGAVIGRTKAEREDIIKDVREVVEKTGFQLHVISLESVYNPDQRNANCFDEGEVDTDLTPEEKLRKVVTASKSLTATQDLLQSLRNNLLLQFAKDNIYTKILLGETATRLSIKLLSNVAQGRGGTLPLDLGVADNRDEDVAMIRPMREFTSKEVAFYNRFEEVLTVDLPSLDTKTPDNASIQRQTEAFITSLQANFPSTTSTIFRTGDKLTLSEEMKITEEKCLLCKAPIKRRGSCEEVSCRGMEEVSINSCCGEGDGSCSSRTPTRLSKDEAIAGLCYGCRLTFKDMKNDVSSLPPFAIAELGKNNRRQKMKESIQDFLLE